MQSRFAWWLCIAAISSHVAASDVPGLRGLTYTHLQRTAPRPLHIHTLRVDLQDTNLDFRAVMAPDPDGSGPAETSLSPALAAADREGLVAAVNANAWNMLPLPGSTNRPPYVAGGACDVNGWVLNEGGQRSPPESRYCSLWLDRYRRPRIERRSKPAADAVFAVAGFGDILHEGKVLVDPSSVRHPRTAAGFDADRRYLILVVVDGRQPGYSEGVSEYELAGLMKEFGCVDALNLDGGGSSVLLLREGAHPLRILNRPSDLGGPRPVPVLLGVRTKLATR